MTGAVQETVFISAGVHDLTVSKVAGGWLDFSGLRASHRDCGMGQGSSRISTLQHSARLTHNPSSSNHSISQDCRSCPRVFPQLVLFAFSPFVELCGYF